MPQLNSDEAANDEPTTYNVEGEEENRWGEDDHLNDIKGDLLNDIDREPRNSNNNKSHSNGEASNKDRLERDPRDEIKGPGRPNYLYPPDIGSIVSGLHPSIFQNGGLPPTSKVPYPYSVPYHPLLYGASPSPDIDSKGRCHPDIPSMYALPGQLGQIPHPLAPWPTAPLYPICTASTMASMLRYPHPFGPFASSAAAAAVVSNMPRFPLGPGHPHGPGMHPTMIPHPALVTPHGSMGNGHGHHGKHDQEKQSGRHSKSESNHSHSKRDRPYVKKPLNAFMLYMKEQRAKVVAECTLKESAAINQILGRKWHSLNREEQQKYYEMARKERQLHLQLYPGWSARDNYGKRKKRKKEKSQGECTDSPLRRERSYASLGPEHLYARDMPTRPISTQNPKKCRAVFGLEQQQMWCAPCRRKKKCIRYQHDDDSDEDDMSPVQSPQFQNFPNQNPFDGIRSTSPLSMTSQSNNATNGNSDFIDVTSSSSRLPGNQISPQQPLLINDIKQEMRTSPLGMDGPPTMVNKNFDPYTNRHPGRAPSSDNSFKSEGSPNSQGADSNSSHGNGPTHRRHNNGNHNNNNSKDSNRLVTNGNSNTVHRQVSAPPSSQEGRNNFRKTNSLDGSDVPGTSGLGGRNHSSGGQMPHLNTSGGSNVSEDSPGSRTHHRSLSSSLNKSNGPHTPQMPHPSPLHTPTAGLFLPPPSRGSPLLSPGYAHSNPHGGHPFMTPYPPYFNQASMLAAAFGAPPSPLGGLIGLSQFNRISPSSIASSMGGHTSGSNGGPGSQSRVTAGTVVEGKS